MSPAQIPATLAECWQRGQSIAETIGITRRRHHAAISFDEVREHFVQLAQEHYGDPDDLWDDPDQFDDDDEEAALLDACGMTPDGTCLLAGTEQCDWECPRS